MKITITQSFAVEGRPAFISGDVLDLPTEVAIRWIKAGLAKAPPQVETTSLPLAPENTSVPPSSEHKRAQSQKNLSTRR